MAFKGSATPSPAGSGLFGIDAKRDVRAVRKYGMVVAHNHIYWGHGISVGSEPSAITITSSDAKLTIKGVNLPLTATADNRNVITGASNLFGSTWGGQY